jgi:hypothetical protein
MAPRNWKNAWWGWHSHLVRNTFREHISFFSGWRGPPLSRCGGLDPQGLWPANNKCHQKPMELPSKTGASPRQTEGKQRVCVGFPWGFGMPHDVPIRPLQVGTLRHCKILPYLYYTCSFSTPVLPKYHWPPLGDGRTMAPAAFWSLGASPSSCTREPGPGKNIES